jgi:hypothetical protein
MPLSHSMLLDLLLVPGSQVALVLGRTLKGMAHLGGLGLGGSVPPPLLVRTHEDRAVIQLVNAVDGAIVRLPSPTIALGALVMHMVIIRLLVIIILLATFCCS